jgi:hypothetical protein
MLIVTIVVGAFLAIATLVTSPKEVSKEFFKKGFWIIMGAFVFLYLSAILLKSM